MNGAGQAAGWSVGTVRTFQNRAGPGDPIGAVKQHQSGGLTTAVTAAACGRPPGGMQALIGLPKVSIQWGLT